MQSCLSSYEGSWKAFMTTISQGALADVEAALSSALADGAVITAPAALDAYTADTYWPALHAKAAGAPIARPDVVVRPRTEEDVATVLAIASERRVPVVPWGGGSGTQGGALAINGGIVIDLRSLDEVIEIDEQSMTVSVQAGKNGRDLEAELNARGLMLPHYPASVEWATVGGYIAARGSGVLSTRYGKIEDLVLSLRVATPVGGLADTIAVPRHAMGPELTQLFIGSEGTLGVITRATLQLVPLPAERRFAAVAFPTVTAGIGAIRRTLQLGHRPSVVRMYDEEATRLTFAPVVGEDLSGVYTVLAFEGEAEAAALEERRTLELAVEAGGRGGRPAPRHRRGGPARGRASGGSGRAPRCSPGRWDSAGGPGATTSPPRRTSPSCRRSGARSTSSRRTPGSRRCTRRCDAPCASPTATPGSSCGCTSP